MAKRFGGKYSPDGAAGDGSTPPPAADLRRPDPAGARANLLFVPPIVLVATSFGDGAVGLGAAMIGALSLLLGAWLLRDGLRAEAAYNARKIARRPALPRKILAADLAGIGVAIAVWKETGGLAGPIIYGLIACGLHLAAFGLDPLKSKGAEGIDQFQQDRVARAVDAAEAELKKMQDAILRARDGQLERRVEKFAEAARHLFRTVENDPRDLTAARKYLSVYLTGAREATVTFADIYARRRDPNARADYVALLDDLEKNFAARTEKLLDADRSDLTIEIDVLRDRLAREGVKAPRDNLE